MNINSINKNMYASEHWERWEPIPGLSPRYNIESILDNFDGFKIVLFDIKNHQKKVHVFFENSVDAYRWTDESFRLTTISDLSDNYEDKFFSQWSFFKVTNSEYLMWLSDQSYTVSEHLPFLHFAFIDDNSILDVVTTYEPKVELITAL